MGMARRRNLDELPSEQVPGHEHGAWYEPARVNPDLSMREGG
jgi:hypothetical protein